MTVGKAGSRRPVATGCGAAPAKPSKPASRPSVSTGCGSSSSGGGWKAKTVTGGKSGKTTGLSERAKSQLEKAKTTKGGGKGHVSSGCGSSTPSKPSHPVKPARTGC
jgi:hypothetical protein